MRSNQVGLALRKQAVFNTRKSDLLTQNKKKQDFVSKHSIVHIARKNPRAKLLIIRALGGIGDVLMTTPVLKHLKKEFPDVEISYAMDRVSTGEDTYYQLLKNAPFIDKFLDARYLDKSKYDGVVDLTSVCIKYEHSNKQPLNRIDIFAQACGVTGMRDHLPFYKVEGQEDVFAQQWLAPYASKKLVVLHTASFDAKRSWPAGKHEELISLAAQRPDIHFLLSDFNNVVKNKDKLKNVLDITNKDIRKVAAVINRADLFVGPDSGLMHLAGALNKPSLVLFGSIPPATRINYYPYHVAIEAERKLSCQYCWYANCSVGFKCMKDITAEQVYKKILET